MTGYSHKRRLSEKLKIGQLGLGGDNPIRIQSMTNTDTKDVDATYRQCAELAEAGCELIRITVPSEKDIQALEKIKTALQNSGVKNPLIADVHFNPRIAEITASIVEKVRINPGNYFERKTQFSKASESEYRVYLEGIRKKIIPLLDECKKHDTAIRIGTNHGSLSERIVFKYGNGPEGMAESAMEFVRICEEEDFHKLVLSMKSSNPLQMIHASRLLVKKMQEEGFSYPLHLGVTEAGIGREGIIRSVAGLATLLEQGIGDTIRISLTGNPLNEILPARSIARLYNSRETVFVDGIDVQHTEYNRRKSISIGAIGGDHHVALISEDPDAEPELLVKDDEPEGVCLLKTDKNTTHSEIAGFFHKLHREENFCPVIIQFADKDPDIIKTTALLAPSFLNGNGDGLWVKSANMKQAAGLAADILQACRLRINGVEYISCPSCGRTRYDMESVLEKVKAATSGFKGMKIAIMGCIVNGPGEMADADYGYVGSGLGKVSLYKGKECVLKNIDESFAIDELVKLISKQYSQE